MLALALIVALVAPYFINWTDYRTDFEREASRILGQPVTVAGDTEVRLLPFPSVTFEDVRVGPAAAPLAVADRFSMDAELAPFMRGEVLIFDMRVINPTVTLELEEDGLPNWPIHGNTPISPAQVSLENARIINGTVELRDPNAGRTWRLSDFHAQVSAESLFGPFRIEGDGRLNNQPMSVRVSTGNLNAKGFGLRTVFALPREAIEIVADGRIVHPEGDGEELYGGTFTMRPLGGGKAQPFSVAGDFSATARRLDIPEFHADFGEGEDPYTVSGAAGISGGEEPRYNIEVQGTQITLPGDQEEGQAAASGGGDPVISLADRLLAVQSTLAQLPIPPIPGSINLDLPAILAGDTTIRDIKLNASPDDAAGSDAKRRWSISHFEAKLPGRTVVEANGILQLPDEDTSQLNAGGSFQGKLILASRQPSGLASWLTGSVDDAIRRLPNAGLSADVNFTPERQTVRDLEVILGPARMTGSVVRVSAPERRNTLDVALSGERIDVDALEALASVFVGKDGVSRFAQHDLDVALELQQPDIRGVAVDTLSASLRSRDRTVEVDRFSVTGLFGASVSATATLEMGDDGRQAAVDATVVAPSGSELIEGLAGRFPDVPVLAQLQTIAARDTTNFTDTRLDVVGTVATREAANDETSLSISGTTGGTELSITTSAEGALDKVGEAKLFLDASLQNPEAEMLISQAGFDYFVIDSPGPLEVEINAGGTLLEGLDTSLKLTGGDMVTEIKGRVTEEDWTPIFEGEGSVEARDIEPWIAGFGYRLPGMGLGTNADLHADLAFRKDTRVVQDISGTLSGGSVAGTIAIEAEAGGPVVRGDISLEYLNAGELYATVTGDASAVVIQASAEDALDRLFSDPLVANHDIEVALAVSEVALPVGDRALENLSSTFVYRDGAMSVRDLKADFGGGTVTGLAELQNTAGTLLLNAQLTARDVEADALVPRTASVLEGTTDLSLQLTGTGRSTAGLLASLTGSGVLETDALTVSGVRANGFGELIRRADAIGYDIDPDQIRTIARNAFLSGKTELPPTTIPVSVTNGELRINNASAQTGGLTVSGDFNLDVLSAVLSGHARLTLDAGDEAVAGPQPEIVVDFSAGDGEGFDVSLNYEPVIGFVTQRALEREQARVEAMQAVLLEKQRLRREVRLYEYRKQARLQALEETRLRSMAKDRAEQERRRAEEEAARKRREQEAAAAAERKRQAEEEAAAAEERAREAAPSASDDAVEVPEPELDVNRLLEILPETRSSRPLGPLNESMIQDRFGPSGDGANSIFSSGQ